MVIHFSCPGKCLSLLSLLFSCPVLLLLLLLFVTQAGFGSRIKRFYDPAPPTPRRATLHYSESSVSIPSKYVCSHKKPVSVHNKHGDQASAIATCGSTGAPLTPSLPKKHRRRRRRQAQRAANRNSAASSATPMTPDAPISAQQVIQERPSHSQRAATPHPASGRQCTRLPGL